ncbi:N-glycosylase/DNA lyase-like protein [Emericellopsis cladophorae]|uniref:DNA-(apurinic or apyrimidinic site) lyase n=1 Tax=Emericellopsis cladophorae TaxID=2686198 RepID=A0A9P9Y596_9HYPO|nr:N-glycosylase/DNA lyase-like protein [Emericellopsis cladophorae]KAI6783762.1 N-glycosylase/DNA lyase-like protein [Emericellopsis cladophorae]
MVAHDKPSGWLESLRNPESPAFGGASGDQELQAAYKQAHDELLTLKGVGPKVADCVCLMGLGWGESVPVDTHVWQIAQRDYKFGKKSKTFNKVAYDAVGDHFRVLWGKYAGWAHSVLFTADLKQFAEQAAVKGEDATAVQVKEETTESHGVTTKRKRVTTVKTEVKTEVKIEDVEDPEGFALALPRKRRRTRQTRSGS